jgi:phospholipase C
MVFANNAWDQVHAVNREAGDTVPSVIPPRIGGQSPIKHVVVLVKENRNYDQVLGDLDEGNGDPSYAQVGQTITPNHHALAERYGDSTMDPTPRRTMPSRAAQPARLVLRP